MHLLVVALLATAAQCTPTQGYGGGPDRSPPLRAKIGTGHVLTGVVLTPACTPVRRARVSFWQSNAKGVYVAALTGAVLTDRNGRFRFEGPRPASHMHIKVEARGFLTLFTEYFPAAGSSRGSVRLVLTPDDL
jgi:protocatechuate 3,4-dioxygenase beta subunit